MNGIIAVNVCAAVQLLTSGLVGLNGDIGRRGEGPVMVESACVVPPPALRSDGLA